VSRMTRRKRVRGGGKKMRSEGRTDGKEREEGKEDEGVGWQKGSKKEDGGVMVGKRGG